MIILQILILIAGLALILFGAEILVNGASSIARKAGLSEFLIGLTIVGYLYRRGIEKNQMGYASAIGLVLLAIALAINMVQLVATGTFKKEE